MQNVYKLTLSNCLNARQTEKTGNKRGQHKSGTENHYACTMLQQAKTHAMKG